MPTVLITGSGRRLGRGLALMFAQKGWDIIIHYNNSEEMAKKTYEEIKNIGVKTYLVKADVSNSFEVSIAFNAIRSHFTFPDVLINNSGIFPEKTNFSVLQEELWDQVINVNLKGEFLCSQLFAKYAKSGSKIINIASLGGFEVWNGRIPYNVSKAGVLQLTKALSRELAPNIAVNSVSPGTIIIPEEPAEDSSNVEVSKIPMGRYGNISDLFDAVYFFATASNFITGQNLSVDGGYHNAR